MNSKEKNTTSCKMIYIYGSGGRGKLIREILLRSKQKARNIMFIDDIKKSFNNSNFLLKKYDHKKDQIFIGISDPIIHKKKYQELKKKLKKIDNQPLIDPTAIIKSNVKLNKNIRLKAKKIWNKSLYNFLKLILSSKIPNIIVESNKMKISI